MSTSPPPRSEIRDRLVSETFDIVIVGGGINGAGIARDAALRGYRVALLEKGDFAAGTSSRSSRLIHGGLRYLEQGEVGLVFESVSERARLARLARHIVRPLPFVYPVYRSSPRDLWTVDIGLWLYDGLALFRNYRTHDRLSARDVTEHLPGIRRAALRGGVLYYDYRTDDARLVLENVLAATEDGAAPLSYARVEGATRSDGRIRAVQVHDLLADETFEVRGRAFVCATGPWTDLTLDRLDGETAWLRPTKGIHVVVPGDRLSLDAALLMRHPDDGRAMFGIPYFGHTVLGTTDTDFEGDPGEARPTLDDVSYLLEAARAYFPAAEVEPADVISSWAGIRPLIGEEGATDPSDVSREHRIEVRDDGLVIIAGGKLTTYRRMAAECVEEAVEAVVAGGGAEPPEEARTWRLPLPGARGIDSDDELDGLIERLAERTGDEVQAGHLARTYGMRAHDLLDEAEGDEASRPLVEGLPYVPAEVDFACRHEMARRPADILRRRTQLFYRSPDQGLSVVEEVATRMAEILGWSEEERTREVERYRGMVETHRGWREGLPT